MYPLILVKEIRPVDELCAQKVASSTRSCDEELVNISLQLVRLAADKRLIAPYRRSPEFAIKAFLQHYNIAAKDYSERPKDG
jgi:hypothetical protein